MLKLIASLNALLMPVSHSQALSDVMGSARTVAEVTQSEGADVAACLLTRQHRWSVLAQAISQGDLALSRSETRALLQNAPSHAIPPLYAALRSRMSVDLSQGLGLLSPARNSPFNGVELCRTAPLQWRQKMINPLTRLHDIRVTFQRRDCISGISASGLSLHTPAGHTLTIALAKLKSTI